MYISLVMIEKSSSRNFCIFLVPGLRMKLPGQPGQATHYKFNVNELRELAKSAHQVDAGQGW